MWPTGRTVAGAPDDTLMSVNVDVRQSRSYVPNVRDMTRFPPTRTIVVALGAFALVLASLGEAPGLE